MAVNIELPPEKRVVEDWDILFTTGMLMPITVDAKAGDTFAVGERTIQIHLVSKPSLNTPNKMLPAEDVTIWLDKVVSVQHRVREVVEMTPEQKFLWAEDFKKMVTDKTVN